MMAVISLHTNLMTLNASNTNVLIMHTHRAPTASPDAWDDTTMSKHFYERVLFTFGYFLQLCNW